MHSRLSALFLATALVACGPRADRNRTAVVSEDGAGAQQEGSEGTGPVAHTTGAVTGASDTLSKLKAAAPLRAAYMKVPGGNAWVTISGQEKKGIPVILIHDGPGGSSFSLKSLEALSDERPVLRYDQLGSGRSQIIYDHDLYTMAHFVMELDLIRSHFKYPRVHLVAHSWGAAIALEYYKAHPNEVASLTLQSPEIDYPLLRQSIATKIRAMPEEQRKVLELGSSKHSSPAYQNALLAFVNQYVCCRKFIEADMDSTARSQNDTSYAQLRGVNEITINGSLADYRATPILSTVRIPTLFTVGESDVSDGPTVQKFAAMTPGASIVVIKGTTHFPTWEAPEENVRIIRDFLHRVK
jgi:proline iminopeptidase